MNQRDETRSPRLSSPSSIFWVAFGFFALLGSLWAAASPVFAVPDENAHATKAIAQVHGQVIGRVVPHVPYIVVDLPKGDRYNPQSVCFVRHPDRSADCAVAFGSSGTTWFSTWVGAYNPLYYYLVGWPSLVFTGPAAVYAMRLVSALVGALFLAWATQAALGSARVRWMPVGIAFLASPMIVYFIGSVNPQGLEVASGASLWLGLSRLLQTHSPKAQPPRLSRAYLWTIVGVSAIVLANVRALGPLWVVVIAAFSLVVAGWAATRSLFTTWRGYWWIGAIAAGGLFSLVWTLMGGSLSGQAGAADVPLVNAGFVQGFLAVIRNTPFYVTQAVGYFGWLDTPLHPLVAALFIAVFVVLVALALIGTSRRQAATVLAAIAVSILVPAVVQGYSVHQTGLIWQGRYGLFLFIAIPIFASMALSSGAGARLDFLSGRATAFIVVALAVFSALSYVLVLRRYVVGNAVPITQMIRDPQWSPPVPWPVLVLTFVLVWAAFAWWLTRLGATAARFEPRRLQPVESD